jgi:pyrroline-5-carboxylate reductase
MYSKFVRILFSPNRCFQIISMMAAVNFATVLQLVRREGSDSGRTARIVPLPSAAHRYGPILCHPAGLSDVEQIVGVVGTVVACAAESEMKPLVSITGHISAFYEYLDVVQSWARTNGGARLLR